MTQTCTQKRYRQYHHDNNTAPRFRDLPPRFKRQKSSTKSEAEESALENQENKDFFPLQPTSPSSQPDTDRTVTMKQPNLFKQNLPFSDPALSVNTKLYSSPPFQVVDQFGRGYLCYPEGGTPPMSPYGLLNTRPADGAAAQRLPQYSESARSIPTSSSEAMSPCLEMAKVSMPGAKSETVKGQSGRACASPPQATRPVQSPMQCSDLSDPDLRTMEMLRELERVADQKEKEDQERERKEREESGDMKDSNDRKNYVSHHLRMLMCAVDRYTADIDEPEPSANVSGRELKAASKADTWQARESGRKASPPVVSSPSHYNIQDKSTMQSSRSNQTWQHSSSNNYESMANYPTQQWQQQALQFTSAQSMGCQMSHSPVLLPVTPAQAPHSYLPVSPPLLHHVLTPPPSRTASPHPSPCMQKSAPVTPQGSFFPKQHSLQNPHIAKALVFNNGNEMQGRDPRFHMPSADGFGQGWDIWSGPSIFDIPSNVNAQKERKPLYNR